MNTTRTAVIAFSAGILVALALPVLAQVGSSSFSDVRTGDYFSDAVNRMARLGVVRGYSNGRFGPNDGITRGQSAVLLDRYDQTVVASLRAQMEELRRKAGMGYCGDKTKQTGEQCDDGNMNDGDGCSHECIQETAGSQPQGPLCEGRYQIGENYPSSDGCNTCTCTQNGSACTLRACNNPNTCQPIVCGDGRQYPSCTTSGAPINYFANPCSVPGSSSSSSNSSSSRSSSSSSSSQGTTSCETEKNDFKNTVASNRTCTVDADCTLFIASCPYLTCGEAIRKDATSKLEGDADDYFICRQKNNEQMACAGCAQQRAVCQAGLCTVK
ncbi:MAG TPA: S-layer homology domain-containing protein [Candidatus Peribacteria bacterium]|nr:S-layer homology domain-containing protein [Candidatus Peribacteria bacterium]